MEKEYFDYKKTLCSIWRGYKTTTGYATFKGKYIHRKNYTFFFGAIPKGLQLDHLCRVRLCVNPWHLEVVTPQENNRRGLRGILKTFCAKGHDWIVNKTRNSSTGDCCIICRRLRGKMAYQKIILNPIRRNKLKKYRLIYQRKYRLRKMEAQYG